MKLHDKTYLVSQMSQIKKVSNVMDLHQVFWSRPLGNIDAKECFFKEDLSNVDRFFAKIFFETLEQAAYRVTSNDIGLYQDMKEGTAKQKYNTIICLLGEIFFLLCKAKSYDIYPFAQDQLNNFCEAYMGPCE